MRRSLSFALCATVILAQAVVFAVPKPPTGKGPSVNAAASRPSSPKPTTVSHPAPKTTTASHPAPKTTTAHGAKTVSHGPKTTSHRPATTSGSTAAARKSTSRSTTTTTSGTSPAATTPAFVARIQKNPNLTSRLEKLLPNGTTLSDAATGFRNQGQFIAALHVSKNLNIPFTELKTAMTGEHPLSLGQAIQQAKANADAQTEASLAQKQATEDMQATAVRRPPSGKR